MEPTPSAFSVGVLAQTKVTESPGFDFTSKVLDLTPEEETCKITTQLKRISK